jgi:RimJ/RimL family protein N-acetyltransferase
VIEPLFTPLNNHRLLATVDARNETAAGLLEKLGFRREAHFRKNIFFKGEWGDVYAYALLRSEWK